MITVWRVQMGNGDTFTQFTTPMTPDEFREHLKMLFAGYRVTRFRPQRGGAWHDVCVGETAVNASNVNA